MGACGPARGAERDHVLPHAAGHRLQVDAERARRDWKATAETARRRTANARDLLTTQEAQIARMASDGMTNREIAAHLYLSHRTVEWHMRELVGKLGISSRSELGDALGPSQSELLPA